MKTHITTFLACCLLAAASAVADADEHPAKLVGRWRSENMPIGHWVVDRYSDGRLAKKKYVQYDYAKPAEVNVTWGRWRLRGQTYSEFLEGTTSEYARVWNGKWWKTRVQRITPQRFSRLSSDGHDSFENRLSDQRPLLDVQQPPPKEYGWKKLLDTVTPNRSSIPRWVNGVPVPQ